MFHIIATNTGGKSTFSLAMSVNDVVPVINSYSAAQATYVKGVGVVTNTPTTSGGVPTSFSVNPAVPTGLVFDTATGKISGTPENVVATTKITIVASNSGGSSNAYKLDITINDAIPEIE